MPSDRRQFLIGTFGATVLAALPAELFAESTSPQEQWSSGRVRHLLPTVSDTEMLIKVSFITPLGIAPTLKIGATRVRGTMNDTRGEFWQFRATGLRPGRRYTLSLTASNGRPLCDAWELSAFPAATALPGRFRILFFSCAGGHESLTFLPIATRRRLLRRALTFAPDAVVANGDHVYWDLLSPASGHLFGNSPEGQRIAGTFSRSALVFGGNNETVLRRAVDPQVASLYGTDFRSTPVFFIQGDHDYFDNDDATDPIVTFPPSAFMLQLARATQRLYYPEFLPEPTRPGGWPSGRRGVGATRPSHLDLTEQIAPIEQHGFTVVDFTPDGIDMQFFKWDVITDAIESIDSLQPFHSTHLPRPG